MVLGKNKSPNFQSLFWHERSVSPLHLEALLPCVEAKGISGTLLEESLGDLCNEIRIVHELNNAADEKAVR